MKDSIYVELMSIILSIERLGLLNMYKKELPRIFYIGHGKSGSSRIFNFENVSVAHWHNTEYFESQYQTSLLTANGYDIYDFILQMGKRNDFKPLIIEFTREPINRGVSVFCQVCKRCRCIQKSGSDSCYICRVKSGELNTTNVYQELHKLSYYYMEPYSCTLWKEHFNIDLYTEFDPSVGYYYKELNNVILLFARFEDDIGLITPIFKRYGFDYNDKIVNSTNECQMPIVKFVNTLIKTDPKRISYPNDLIDKIYSQDFVKVFYSPSEIVAFKHRFCRYRI